MKNNSPFDDNFWINGIDTPEIRAWSGYAFEQICLLHLPQIKTALGINSVQTQTSAWVGSDVWLTFITTNGLSQNTYAQSLVHQSLTMEALFANNK